MNKNDYQNYYNTKTKTIEMPDDNTILPEGGIGNVLFHKLKEHSNKIAQIDSETGIEETFNTFLGKTIRTACSLKSMNVQPHDIVMLCSNNHLNCAVPYLASLFIGGISTGIDPSFTQEETSYLINLVKPKVVFVISTAEHKIRVAVKENKLNTEVIGFNEEFVEKCLNYECNEKEFSPYFSTNVQDTACILFSSGTTGFPKAICLGHHYFLHCLKKPYSFNLVFTSFYWLSAVLSFFLTTYNGVKRILVPDYESVNMNKLWNWIYTYNVEYIFLAPVIAMEFVNAAPINVSNCPLKLLLVAGSAVSEQNLRHLKNTLSTTKIVYGYGQTELVGTLAPIDCNTETNLWCCGYPNYGRHYRIVDPDTELVLGFNKPGELRIKSKWMLNGYYGIKNNTAYIDKDGFFKTGDILSYDENFRFRFIDRVKDMFKYRSWHIVPAKIELILNQHPDIEIGIVVGVPHVVDDAHAMAIVKCRPKSCITEDQIRKFVNQRVDDRHQLRAGVKIVEQFVLTNTGKINRRLTRDKVLHV